MTVGDVIAVVAAGAACAAAAFTWRLSKSADAEANATQQMVSEMVHDREMAWRPYLLIAPLKPTPQGTVPVEVTNVGRGPALTCRLASCHAAHPGMWHEASAEFVVAASGTALAITAVIEGLATAHPVALPEKAGSDPANPIGGDASFATSAGDLYDGVSRRERGRWPFIVVCQDAFANQYRFTQGRAEPDVCRKSDRERPKWAVGSWARPMEDRLPVEAPVAQDPDTPTPPRTPQP